MTQQHVELLIVISSVTKRIGDAVPETMKIQALVDLHAYIAEVVVKERGGLAGKEAATIGPDFRKQLLFAARNNADMVLDQAELEQLAISCPRTPLVSGVLIAPGECHLPLVGVRRDPVRMRPRNLKN